MTVETTRKDALDREPSEIAERAGAVGRERLDRTNIDILLTATIGGKVSIGGLAAMLVVGATLSAAPGLSLYTALALGGLIMTALTWVLLAVHNTIADVFAIFSAGYVLFGANLSHSIIGASLLFVGFPEAGKTLMDVGVWVAIATIGNLVGGVGLVTLFRFVQAREQGKQA